jgi:hypothetical protein
MRWLLVKNAVVKTQERNLEQLRCVKIRDIESMALKGSKGILGSALGKDKTEQQHDTSDERHLYELDDELLDRQKTPEPAWYSSIECSVG